MLLGHVFGIDIPARQVQISWLMLGCGDLKFPDTQNWSNKGYCGNLDQSVDFYVDGCVSMIARVHSSLTVYASAINPTFSYDIDSVPIDPTTGKPPLYVQAPF